MAGWLRDAEAGVLDVLDDSGFLALVVPATYQTFVARNWEFDQLTRHFREQMARGSLLIWGTGLEGSWRVDVRVGGHEIEGFRAAVGPLCVKGGSVHLTNYESLTMAAQFDDVRLPEPHETGRLIGLPDGAYRCQVVQMFDPNMETRAQGAADFTIILSQSSALPPEWSEIPWFNP